MDYTTNHRMRPAAADEDELLTPLCHIADANLDLRMILQKPHEF